LAIAADGGELASADISGFVAKVALEFGRF
jgi:hypothetical protein